MRYIKEKAPSVKSKVKQINKKIGKLVSKKEDAINKAKELADSEEPSGKMQASLAKIQLRQSESEAEKLMLQKQAEILKGKIDTAKKKEKTTKDIDIEEMENRPITILEGVMSDIHQMISNHKNFDSFQKEFFKEYGHKKVMKKTPEFLEWLEALYTDSQFAVAEAKESLESESPNNITCGNCAWTWLKQDGGDDMYTCHKCGTDNAPSLGESTLNDWAMKKSKEIDNMKESKQMRYIKPLTEGIYAKQSKIQPGEYIQTQYGYFYKRVEGQVGGQDAYVEIKKGKEGKKKTSIHDTVDFNIVDKSIALDESIVTEGMSKSAIKKAIKVIDQQIEDEEGGDGEPLDNETLQALEQERERLLGMLEKNVMQNDPEKYVESRKNLKFVKHLHESFINDKDISDWEKEHGNLPIPKKIIDISKNMAKEGFIRKATKSVQAKLWIALEGKSWMEMKDQFGDIVGTFYGSTFYTQMTDTMSERAAYYAYSVSMGISDKVANDEEIEPAYYEMKSYFNAFGMDYGRNRIFDRAVSELESWMKKQKITTL